MVTRHGTIMAKWTNHKNEICEMDPNKIIAYFAKPSLYNVMECCTDDNCVFIERAAEGDGRELHLIEFKDQATALKFERTLLSLLVRGLII